MHTPSYLSRHLLIAMPALDDPNFARGVTLICQHSEDGAMGLTVNRPSDWRLGEVMRQIGVIIATAASWGLSSLMGVPYAFDPSINLLSLVFAAGIGVLFGYFPARRAARMDPIEALRHE